MDVSTQISIVFPLNMAILNKKQKNAATAKRGYVPSHETVKSVTEPKEVTFSHLTM